MTVATHNTPTQIDLLRHGEHALGSVICGTTDPQLTAKGWHQLQDCVHRQQAAGHSWDVCISSPRLRCSEFAERVSGELNIPCYTLPGIAETDFGAWEGLDYQSVQDRYPGQWQQWLSDDVDAEHAPHGGESYRVFAGRVSDAFSALVASHQHQRILALTHGGVIRAMMAHVLDLKVSAIMNISVPHACHTRFMAYHQPGETDWLALDGHNMHPHTTPT